MQSKRNFLILAAMPISVAVPAIALFAYAEITDNPRLRPLGITREALAVVEGESEFLSIIIHVDWGTDRTSGMSKQELYKLISGTLDFRTDDYFFRFNDVPGTDVTVRFDVGQNSYGPFPPSHLIDGIIPALRALDVTKKARM